MVRTHAAPVLLLLAALAVTALSAPKQRKTLDLERLSKDLGFRLQLEKIGKLPPVDRIVQIIECAGDEADPAIEMLKTALKNTGEFVGIVKALLAKWNDCGKENLLCLMSVAMSAEKQLGDAQKEVAQTIAAAKVIAINYNACLNGTVTPSS